MSFQTLQIDSESSLANVLNGKYYASKNTFYTVDEIIKLQPLTGKLLENFVRLFFTEQYLQENAPEVAQNPEQNPFTPIMVTSKAGAFDRIYGPIVAKEDDKIVISAGLVQVPIVQKSGKITHESLEIEVDIISTRFNGYDDTPVFNITIFSEAKDLTISVNLPLRFRKLEKDEKLPTVKELANMLKRKPADLLGWLGAPPKPSLPTVAAKQLPPDEYEVIDYSLFKTADNRDTGTFTVKGNLDGVSGLLTQEYIDPDDASRETYIPLEMIQVWVPKEVLGTLSLNPIVSEEYPAKFSVRSVTPGKKAGSFRVESGFLLNPDAPKVEAEEEDLSFLEL
jgi:hypothetical protein